MKMTNPLLLEVFEGSQSAIDQFSESGICAVIDWRYGLEEIAEALAPFLPQGYLQLESSEEASYRVSAGGRDPHPISISKALRQEDLIEFLNGVLKPSFELRQFTPVDGDGYSIYVAPPELWHRLEQDHPVATEKYFLSIERLAAYWRKGYWARLFSKP